MQKTGLDVLEKRTVEEVLEHHIVNLAKGDVAQVVRDYAADAFIINPFGIVRGRDELTDFFRNSVDNVLPPDTVMEITCKRIAGEVAYIVWSAESRFYSIPLGTDTFIIKNGKIVAQTFAGLMNKKTEEKRNC